LLEEHQGRAFNTFVLHGPDGNSLGVYRKIHRFRLLEEEKYLAAGDELGLVDAPWGATGLSICYDLRFPEMFRSYAIGGARLLLVVAEWPVSRIEHWSKLLLARAIENQAFVAAVNKVGESQGVRLGGRSVIIDPWGQPLVEGDDQEALLTAEIDFKEADKARRFIPVFKDRREDLY
jgi:omega-amidase